MLDSFGLANSILQQNIYIYVYMCVYVYKWMYLALMLSACVPLTTVYPTDCNLVFSSWAGTSKICRGNWEQERRHTVSEVSEYVFSTHRHRLCSDHLFLMK